MEELRWKMFSASSGKECKESMPLFCQITRRFSANNLLRRVPSFLHKCVIAVRSPELQFLSSSSRRRRASAGSADARQRSRSPRRVVLSPNNTARPGGPAASSALRTGPDGGRYVDLGSFRRAEVVTGGGLAGKELDLRQWYTDRKVEKLKPTGKGFRLDGGCFDLIFGSMVATSTVSVDATVSEDDVVGILSEWVSSSSTTSTRADEGGKNQNDQIPQDGAVVDTTGGQRDERRDEFGERAEEVFGGGLTKCAALLARLRRAGGASSTSAAGRSEGLVGGPVWSDGGPPPNNQMIEPDQIEPENPEKRAGPQKTPWKLDVDGLFFLDLDKNRRVSATEWRGVRRVDFREWYYNKAGGESKPGRRGISLDPREWRVLVEHAGVLRTWMGEGAVEQV